MGRPLGSKNKVKTAIEHVPETLQSPESEVNAKDDSYIASIKIFGKSYFSEGDTLAEAISNLSPEGNPRGVTVLKVVHGDKTQERILPKLATVRLFASSKDMRMYALKSTVGRFSL